MPFRFRPRVGPFIYTPPARTGPPATSRGDQWAQIILVLGGVFVLGAAVLFCGFGILGW